MLRESGSVAVGKKRKENRLLEHRNFFPGCRPRTHVSSRKPQGYEEEEQQEQEEQLDKEVQSGPNKTRL